MRVGSLFRGGVSGAIVRTHGRHLSSHPHSSANVHEGRAAARLHLRALGRGHERRSVDHDLRAQAVPHQPVRGGGGARGEAVLEGVGELLRHAGDVGEEDVARLHVRPALAELPVAHAHGGLVSPDLGLGVVDEGLVRVLLRMCVWVDLIN